MKLAGVEANRFLAKPDAGAAGILIFGADAMRVALKRQEAIAAIIGPQGEAEMRLTRLSGADLRKSPAPVLDVSREIGFFSGPRVVFVEDATDGATESLTTVLAEWRAGDAQIVVTAGETLSGYRVWLYNGSNTPNAARQYGNHAVPAPQSRSSCRSS